MNPLIAPDGPVANAQQRTAPPGARLAAAGQLRHRSVPKTSRIARRRRAINWSKRLLPVAALLLLGSIAAWPELTRIKEQGRVSFRRTFSMEPDAVRMVQPRYRGVDVRGRPYTLTADTGLQVGPQRINLSRPKGDVTLESGAWMLVEAKDGVYIQHTSQLDLSGDAQLYRDDGTVLRSQTVALDMKAGAAASNDHTHAEGPFGVLDAQGFTLTDKGAVIQFVGPARLVVNGANAR